MCHMGARTGCAYFTSLLSWTWRTSSIPKSCKNSTYTSLYLFLTKTTYNRKFWESFTRHLTDQFQFSTSECIFCHRSFVNFNIFQIRTKKFEDLWFILWTVSVHFLLCMSFSEEVDFKSCTFLCFFKRKSSLNWWFW